MIHATKLIVCFLLTFIATCWGVSAQEWSNWVELGNTSLIDVSISFKAGNNCSEMGGGGYSFWRTYNNMYHERGSVFVTFLYNDCDGREQQGNTTVSLSETGIDESTGYWFLCDGTGISDIRLEEIYLPEKKYWRKLVNGVEVDMWKEKYGSPQEALLLSPQRKPSLSFFPDPVFLLEFALGVESLPFHQAFSPDQDAPVDEDYITHCADYSPGWQ